MASLVNSDAVSSRSDGSWEDLSLTPSDQQQTPQSNRAAQSFGYYFKQFAYGGSLTTKVAKAMVLGTAAGLITFFAASNPIGWAIGVAATVFTISSIAMQAIHTAVDVKTDL
ncbi:MAG: hypothetical protein AAGE99_03805 [Chlamydiota bacterium]